MIVKIIETFYSKFNEHSCIKSGTNNFQKVKHKSTKTYICITYGLRIKR